MSNGSLTDQIARFYEPIFDNMGPVTLPIQVQITFQYAIGDGRFAQVLVALIPFTDVTIRADAFGLPIGDWLEELVEACTHWLLNERPTEDAAFCFGVTVRPPPQSGSPGDVSLLTLLVPLASIDPPIGRPD